MTIYTFQFPAKIAKSDIIPNRAKPRTFEHKGFTIISFDKGGLFFDSQSERIKYNSFESDVNEYWIESEGYAIRLRTHSDDDSIKATLDHFDDLADKLAAMIADCKDSSGYEAAAQARIEERRIERETEERQRAARDAWNVMVDSALVDNAEHDFKAGKPISAEHFETLLKRHGIVLHMRTIGTIRNRINHISHDSASICGQGHLPDSIWIAARTLKEKI